jgi:hypothetical protein
VEPNSPRARRYGVVALIAVVVAGVGVYYLGVGDGPAIGGVPRCVMTREIDTRANCLVPQAGELSPSGRDGRYTRWTFRPAAHSDRVVTFEMDDANSARLQRGKGNATLWFFHGRAMFADLPGQSRAETTASDPGRRLSPMLTVAGAGALALLATWWLRRSRRMSC